MSRRGVTLLIAGIGLAAALLAAWVIPVPYVALIPGPTYNTLGQLNGKPVIQVQGHQTYTASGHLNMVTISYIGGPGSNPPFTIKLSDPTLSPMESFCSKHCTHRTCASAPWITQVKHRRRSSLFIRIGTCIFKSMLEGSHEPPAFLSAMRSRV